MAAGPSPAAAATGWIQWCHALMQNARSTGPADLRTGRREDELMVRVRNLAKERLVAGEFAIGIGLRQARTVDIGKIMRTAGYDFLFIDMEHNSITT
jgi:hypothetical protein